MKDDTFLLKHNKGIYIATRFTEVFRAMYLVHKYDNHDVQLPKEYLAEYNKLMDDCYYALLEGQEKYSIGKFEFFWKKVDVEHDMEVLSNNENDF